MRKSVVIALLLVGALQGVSHAQGGAWEKFWHRFSVDFHRNNCWPEPFIYADRMAARAPFAVMAHNGWRQQNTLSHELFHGETDELTHAGLLRIRWIVTQNPPSRQQVYVLAGANQNATERRVDAVQQAIAQIIPKGDLPPVVLTSKVPLSGSGDYFDMVDRAVRSSIPQPRLPASGAFTGTGGN